MIKIITTTFKHNTDRKPFEILIDREDNLPFCPVKSLLEYCTSRGPPWTVILPTEPYTDYGLSI